MPAAVETGQAGRQGYCTGKAQAGATYHTRTGTRGADGSDTSPATVRITTPAGRVRADAVGAGPVTDCILLARPHIDSGWGWNADQDCSGTGNTLAGPNEVASQQAIRGHGGAGVCVPASSPLSHGAQRGDVQPGYFCDDGDGSDHVRFAEHVYEYRCADRWI